MGLLDIENDRKRTEKLTKELTAEQKEIIDKEMREKRERMNNPNEPEEKLTDIGGFDYRKYDDGFIGDEEISPSLEEERERRGV